MKAIEIRRSLTPYLTAAVAVVLTVLAFYVLHRFTEDVSLSQVADDIASTPNSHIALAVLTMMVSFTAIACYEIMAVRMVARDRVRPTTAAWAGVAGFAISDAVGFHILTGGALRYRIYSREGLEVPLIGQIVVLSWVCLWYGFGFVVGCALAFQPEGVHALVPVPTEILRALGIAILIAFAVYFVWIATGTRKVSLRGMTLPLPGLSTALLQILAGVTDIVASAATLYILLPADVTGALSGFVIVYICSIALGTASHTPGGIGVFDATLIAGLGAGGRPDVLGALVLYRIIYFLLPLLPVALAMLVMELAAGRRAIGQSLREVGKVSQSLMPPLAAGLAFIAGLMLLLSGSLPVGEATHLWLKSAVPLTFLESSHMLASLAGLVLLILSHALMARRRLAWYLTLAILCLGAVLVVAKGLNFGLAAGLVLVFLLLLPFREAFYRQSSQSLFALTPFWLMLIAVTVASAVWLGFFAYRHVAYSGELWWQFSWDSNASRFLRTSVLLVIAVFGLGLYMLLNRRSVHIPPAGPVPDSVRALVAQSPRADATIALLGDKHFLVSDDGSAFLMYGVSGGTLISKGDPVGDRAAGEALAWQMHEMADGGGYRTAFYAARTEFLPLYLDMGLSVLKIGEVARVDVPQFTLEGHDMKDFRYAVKRADREDLAFSIVPAAEVPGMIGEMREVSDAWLAMKSGHEKQFALGNFDPAYLANFDCAVIRKEGRLVAFANILAGADREEMSIDLMRYVPKVSNVLMDLLFARLLLHAQDEGYAWFNLGATPLTGLSDHPLATSWNRIGTLIYQHGEEFFHFEGLRAYKEKFKPVWIPQYLACRSGPAVPKVLLDISALIAGGKMDVIRK